MSPGQRAVRTITAQGNDDVLVRYRAAVQVLGYRLHEDPAGERLRALVTRSEWQLAQQQSDPAGQGHFVAGRAVLRWMLADRLGCVPMEVPLVVDGGRVRVRGRGRHHLSVTHSGGWVLCAVASRAVGVDVQEVIGDAPGAALLRRTCSPAERALIEASPDARTAFTRVWSRKEAVLKAAGIGTAMTLSAVDVSRPRAVGVPAPGRWWCVDVAVDDGVVAAVAVRGHLPRADYSRLQLAEPG